MGHVAATQGSSCFSVEMGWGAALSGSVLPQPPSFVCMAARGSQRGAGWVRVRQKYGLIDAVTATSVPTRGRAQAA